MSINATEYREEVEGVLYLCLLTEMEERKVTTVLLMAIPPVYTPSLLELLEFMGDLVDLMNSVPPKWLLHM